MATICQLVYLPGLYERNPTLRAFPYYLSMQFVQFSSISTACFIYFIPFFQSLQSGHLGTISTTSPPKYPLAAMPKATQETLTTLGQTNTSTSRDRGDYIEITTDNWVTSETRSRQARQIPSSNVDLYRPNW